MQNFELDTSKPFSKQYLQQLAKEIVLTDGIARIRGSHHTLAGTKNCRRKKKSDNLRASCKSIC